ncbi:hypothetical protein C8Q77DRAFT_1066354 [Trametes polyzona]|nr:hypothetical protein C8Q77DRAFT_1066354 [Trametes polyzona]
MSAAEAPSRTAASRQTSSSIDNSPATLAVSVSLEDHLVDALRPLLPLLPNPIAAQLGSILASPPPVCSIDSQAQATEPLAAPPVKTIPHGLLASISKWSRTPESAHALARHNPPLRARDYDMVALLAGTRTCPDRKFPAVPAPGTTADWQATQRRELDDRRAVTAVLNALLTIGGSAVAAFYASGRLAWKNEWRVLLALSVAILVAASEGALYLIWSSRRSKPARGRTPRTPAARQTIPSVSSDKKLEPPSRSGSGGEPNAVLASAMHSSGSDPSGVLRERVPQKAGDAKHPTDP